MTPPTEHAEQVKIIQWFDRQYPKGDVRLFAVPNGGQRHPAVAKKLKDEGVRKGVPDLMLLAPRGGYAGLVIELKRIKWSATTTEQVGWLNHLNAQGFKAVICKGGDAAIETIKSYLGSDA